MHINVYICKGKYCNKYHYNRTCRGLSNCSTAVENVELNEAKRIIRTICGWEDWIPSKYMIHALKYSDLIYLFITLNEF